MIFFDLDDTLLDTQRINRSIFEQIHKQLKVSMPFEDFMALFRTHLRTRMIKHFDFSYNESIGINPMDYLMTQEAYEPQHMEAFKEDLWSKMKGLGLTCSKEDFYQVIMDLRNDFCHFIPGIPELLEKAADLDDLGIITNGISEIQHLKIDLLGLRNICKETFASGDFGYGKPDPRFFHYVLDQAGPDPQDCIMIGDNVQNDVLAPLAMDFKGAIYFNPQATRYGVTWARDPQELWEKISSFYH